MVRLSLIPLLFILFLSVPSRGQKQLFRGYIVTLDGKQLDGHIGAINRIHSAPYLYFRNDFGSDYNILPQLIRGFIFLEDTEKNIFESHYYRRKWLYLQLLYRRKEISLFQLPSIQINWIKNNDLVYAKPVKDKSLWLKIEDQKLIKINKTNFKRRMTKYLKNGAPSLAKKIGHAGYQFNDILIILQEYIQLKKKESLIKRL